MKGAEVRRLNRERHRKAPIGSRKEAESSRSSQSPSDSAPLSASDSEPLMMTWRPDQPTAPTNTPTHATHVTHATRMREPPSVNN